MKTFEEICMMSQAEVKSYMVKYLHSHKYNVVNKDGFVYAKGNIPVLLVAHMDTVHKELCTEINIIDGKMSSHQGIGGDDRCGIFMIMNVIKELNCSVLLCEDEEIGGVGARKFTKSDYLNDVDVNYIIEFDRKGCCDAVFYSCDNKEFKDFVCDATGFKEAYGSFSDISIVAPALKTAAVNLSCGYYNAHSIDEYVMYDEMMDIIDSAKALIKTESNWFEYIEKKHTYSNVTNWFSDLDYFRPDNTLRRSAREDMERIELEVVYINHLGNEEIGYGEGKTKAEAWADFFLSYEDVCFNMINDYSFC